MAEKLFLICGISVLLGLAHGGRVRRVVGGRQMPRGAWPWLVSLNYKEQHAYLELQGLDHLCGGTLIHRYWVITAGHCVHYMSGSEGLGVPSNWVAVLGEYNRRVEERTEQRLEVEEIFLSPNYTLFPKLTGDIALLKLRRPARITNTVKPIEIDTLRDIPVDSECTAAGWGQHAPDDYGQPQYGNGTMVPHVINVKKVSSQNCRVSYTDLWPLIDNTVVCFHSGQRKDTCKGDSGGPLVCLNSARVPVLTGIVSVGLGCALEDYPGIYTRVASYMDWISSTVEENTVRTPLQRQSQPQVGLGDIVA